MAKLTFNIDPSQAAPIIAQAICTVSNEDPMAITRNAVVSTIEGHATLHLWADGRIKVEIDQDEDPLGMEIIYAAKKWAGLYDGLDSDNPDNREIMRRAELNLLDVVQEAAGAAKEATK